MVLSGCSWLCVGGVSRFWWVGVVGCPLDHEVWQGSGAENETGPHEVEGVGMGIEEGEVVVISRRHRPGDRELIGACLHDHANIVAVDQQSSLGAGERECRQELQRLS